MFPRCRKKVFVKQLYKNMFISKIKVFFNKISSSIHLYHFLPFHHLILRGRLGEKGEKTIREKIK